MNCPYCSFAATYSAELTEHTLTHDEAWGDDVKAASQPDPSGLPHRPTYYTCECHLGQQRDPNLLRDAMAALAAQKEADPFPAVSASSVSLVDDLRREARRAEDYCDTAFTLTMKRAAEEIEELRSRLAASPTIPAEVRAAEYDRIERWMRDFLGRAATDPSETSRYYADAASGLAIALQEIDRVRYDRTASAIWIESGMAHKGMREYPCCGALIGCLHTPGCSSLASPAPASAEEGD